MKIRLGMSPCPNDTFMFYDLLHHSKFKDQIELTIADVEELNALLLKGELDITKASFHAIALAQNDYSLLTAGSALGFGCGPLLITK